MNRQTGFSLIELLVVVSLIATLSSLTVFSLKGNSGAAKLSTAGWQVASLIDSARETAILRQTPVAVVLLASGDDVANRVFTVLCYIPPASPDVSGQWKQISRWGTLPQGVLADSGLDSSGNALALTPSGSVNLATCATLPSLTYQGLSYAAKDKYGYIVFMPDGSLYQDAAGSLPSPCVLRLVEGIRQGTGVRRTGQTDGGGNSANYFDIVFIQATGRTKIIRS
ncbi:MAG: Tfp pilus assembly protein FimT/FimU [Chthoniobacteraceae bacterium]